MTLPSIEVNGVDPAGNEPPDECFYRPGGDVEVSLCRVSPNGSPWRLSVYRNGDTTVLADFEDFADGFSMLVSWTETILTEAVA